MKVNWLVCVCGGRVVVQVDSVRVQQAVELTVKSYLFVFVNFIGFLNNNIIKGTL